MNEPTVDELLADVRVIELQPSDVLVFEMDGGVTAEGAHRVKEYVQRLGVTNEILIVEGRVGVLRAATGGAA